MHSMFYIKIKTFPKGATVDTTRQGPAEHVAIISTKFWQDLIFEYPCAKFTIWILYWANV